MLGNYPHKYRKANSVMGNNLYIGQLNTPFLTAVMLKTLCLAIGLFLTLFVFGQTIEPKSATTFCDGGSVTLELKDANGGPSIQWTKDGQIIPNATSNTYVATI